MSEYRRMFQPGGVFFLTLVTFRRETLFADSQSSFFAWRRRLRGATGCDEVRLAPAAHAPSADTRSGARRYLWHLWRALEAGAVLHE
ncbi:MAG: hypothetical protein IPM18_01750 [Phycisphaerales bacterium]|nr:hypothetical protein [Phycisphaerales bacterium]